MFSFLRNSFQKLFNFQKTDTNVVEKDKRVEFESNDGGNGRFKNIQMKDSDLINRFKSNENYQRAEITKYSSSFTSFRSNEIASTSLESNVVPNSNAPINIIHKSQRESSKLAAKKITKMADRLSMQSDVEMSDEGDDKMEKSSKQKVASENTKLKKTRTKSQNTVRFCQKCKMHKIIVGNTTVQEYCDTCKNVLFYVCSYCKEKLYASYKGWKGHESICKRKNVILKLVNVQNESLLHQYSNYNLNETLDYTIGHVKKQGSKDTINRRKIEARSVASYKMKAVDSNKQINFGNLTKWIRRYCETCQKTVKLLGMMKTKNNRKCKDCSTLLQFLCVKCHIKYRSNTDIYYHFQSKCLPVNYKCLKCNFNSTNAKSLTLHLKIQHPVLFQCDLCTYQSQIKANLKRHIESVHVQKGLKCQMCSFTTIRVNSLRRHEQTAHAFE